MKKSVSYATFLDNVPRRTNECWLGDLSCNEVVYVCGYKFLLRLEGTALEIWRMMDGRKTMNEIVDQLQRIFPSANRNAILEDTVEFVLKLEHAGMAAWRSRPLFEEVPIDE